LAATWQQKGLQPSPEADRRTLLRRVYLDVTGLPPTPAEIGAFLRDRSPNAYEKVVDSLLDSPRYGERWGRHWMDIWRYSDWYGRRALDDQRNSARHIWHWRDWIIESLNADKGYDQMIREMIAGDEIAPNDPKVLRATGFLARNYFRFNRNVWMQDTVEHIGFGVLGLTLKCARCHNHKYDPISQEEYYRFRAFFEPYDVRVDPLPGKPDTHEDGISRIFDSLPHEGGVEPYFPPIYKDTFRLIRGEESNPDKTPLTPGTPAVLGAWNGKIEPVTLTPEEHIPDLDDYVERDLLRKAEQDIRNARTAIESSTKWLERARIEFARHPEQPVSDPKKEDKKANVAFADIKSILSSKCKQCHGGATQSTSRSGLILTSEAGALQGGYKYGPAIVPGRSAESPLIRFVSGDLNPRMPPEGAPVTPAELAKLLQWIDQIVEPPAVTLKRAEDRLTLARKHLDTVLLGIPALHARLEADKAKYLHPAEKEKNEKLAETAQALEKKYSAALAAEEMLEAQQLLIGDKAAAAKTKLEAAAKALGQGADKYTPAMEVYPETSTGRRTALAYWLTSRDNPLTARVAINDIWLRHFGKPIVATVSNFGRNGAKPTDQRLLDWLATEFVARKWSIKSMHKIVMMSDAYRRSSNATESAQKQDPANVLLSHMNRRRLESEEIRDAVLQVSGKLNLEMGGAPVVPPLEAEELFGIIGKPENAWVVTPDPAEHTRRSIYMLVRRTFQQPMAEAFDTPDGVQSCPRRNESTTAPQSLALLNSRFMVEQAKVLGATLGTVDGAWERVLDRKPTETERAAGLKFIGKQTALAGSKSAAMAELARALLNMNEFLYVD